MQIYLVGGAVRDQLLKLPIKDRDWVVVGASREQMLALGYSEVGSDFPVFLHPETKEEYALARKERKTAPGYAGFQFQADASVTLEEDLKRRDLTINAIAQDQNGELIDPFNGIKDIQDGILRHVSNAFSEDPVRLLRIARFAARYAKWGFTIAHPTFRLLKEMVTLGEVDALVAERVNQELFKALSEENPEKFFNTLSRCHALSVIMPEIAPLFISSAHTTDNKPDEAVIKNLQSACKLSAVTNIRFAALCQPINETKTVRQFCQSLRVAKETEQLAALTHQYYPAFSKLLQLDPEQLLKLLENLDIYRNKQRFQQWLICCQIIASAQNTETTKHLEKINQAAEIVLSITSKQVTEKNLTGKAFGLALRQCRLQGLIKK